MGDHALSFHSSSKMRGLREVKLRLGRKVRFSSINTALITPATPLVPSRCPTFVLMDPMRSGFSEFLLAQNTLASAPVSIGSPA